MANNAKMGMQTGFKSNHGCIEWSLLAFESMQAVRENLRARAVSKFALQTACTLENSDGEQQALREFFSSRMQSLF